MAEQPVKPNPRVILRDMKPPPENSLIIDPLAIPPEGLNLAGQVQQDLFELTDDKWARAQPPLEYNFTVYHSGDLLLIEGRISCRFQLNCCRCLEWFDDLIELNPYQAEVEIEDQNANLDLTAQLREDILLALPGFPRCNDSLIDPRNCPAAELIRRLESEAVPSGEQDQSAWGALDQLNVDRSSPPTES